MSDYRFLDEDDEPDEEFDGCTGEPAECDCCAQARTRERAFFDLLEQKQRESNRLAQLASCQARELRWWTAACGVLTGALAWAVVGWVTR